MELFTAAPMLLGAKALLRALPVPYIEKSVPENAPDDRLLEIDCKGADLTLLPRGNALLFRQMAGRWKDIVSTWHWLKAYQTAQDYMTQLDRWKEHRDRLDPRTQHSEIVAYLDRHLEDTFLQARTHYQRCEAIGLNLAKVDILAHKSALSKKGIALGGDIRYLSMVQNHLLSSETSLLAYSYYTCFYYQDIFALSPLRKNYWAYLNPFKPHYHYIGHCGLDLNHRMYDGMLIVLEQDFPQAAAVEQLAAKLKRPYAIYRFAKGQFQLMDCLKVLEKLLSRLEKLV